MSAEGPPSCAALLLDEIETTRLHQADLQSLSFALLCFQDQID